METLILLALVVGLSLYLIAWSLRNRREHADLSRRLDQIAAATLRR